MKKLLILVSPMVTGLMLFALVVPALAAPGGVTNPDTLKELAAAREATKQYHDVNIALANGYIPVSPNVPMMGFHYLRFAGANPDIDGIFDVARPEILLYAENGPNERRLVAVEYVASGAEPPEGFTGDNDDWMVHLASCHYADGYEIEKTNLTDCPSTSPGGAPFALWHPDLWALHVWLWEGNPNGIFAAFNPSIP